MFDPIIDFLRNTWDALVRAVRRLIMLLLAPFIAIYTWFQTSGLFLRVLMGAIIIPIIFFYSWFAWNPSARTLSIRAAIESMTPFTTSES